MTPADEATFIQLWQQGLDTATIARELDVPVTIRRVSGGLLFWRSTDEDIQQAQETASRLQAGQRRPQARPRGRRPRGTR